MPPRGPRRVLWVVVVATCACGKGEGCSTRRHETREMRHVHMQVGADHVGDLAHAGKSIWRGMAEPPAMIILGLCSFASAST